jgi:phage-related protein
MEKPIEIIALPQAEIFLDSIEEPVRKKFLHSMRKTKERIIGDWFKKMIGTDDIYEFRVDNNGKFYRLFAFWDSRGAKQTLIVATHGLIKKSNKTPKSDIDKAEDLKNKYFKGLI